MTALRNLLASALSRPTLRRMALRFLARKTAQLALPIARNGFRAHKQSFFVQNFMGAEHIEPERIANCSFHVATHDGTVSMCEHNAHRDEYILVGVKELIRNPVKRGRAAVTKVA